MAGVRQFKGSSSAMTVLVKGTPDRSSSGAPYLVLHVLQTFLEMFKASEPLWRHLLRYRQGDITPSAHWWHRYWGFFFVLAFWNTCLRWWG
ncbi:UNVERIFIED_CONTAM: hypothetical protein Slati_3835000 [Sesamum latifolium]|uniref:Uncharacterized protein n=1 Tax=Sesamum latifolium TaxID=2727402 RepID=A0AAW2TNJ0_9LAMI